MLEKVREFLFDMLNDKKESSNESTKIEQKAIGKEINMIGIQNNYSGKRQKS